ESYSEDDVLEIPGCIDTPKIVHNNDYEAEIEVDDSENWEEEAEEQQSKPQVLIVEDNDELRNYICLELKSEFNTLEAKNGQEGLDLALKFSPDLIISDILMPVKNGIEFCEDIKTNLKTS